MDAKGTSFQSLDSSVLDLENGVLYVSCSAWGLRAVTQSGMGTVIDPINCMQK